MHSYHSLRLIDLYYKLSHISVACQHLLTLHQCSYMHVASYVFNATCSLYNIQNTLFDIAMYVHNGYSNGATKINLMALTLFKIPHVCTQFTC